MRACPGRDALALADRTLSALSAVLGEDHPFTMSCAVNKANCLYDGDQLSAAEGLLRETLERLKRTLRNQHQDTLICEANLAVTLHEQGRTDEAGQLRRQVIAAMEPVFGAEHPSIGGLRGNCTTAILRSSRPERPAAVPLAASRERNTDCLSAHGIATAHAQSRRSTQPSIALSLLGYLRMMLLTSNFLAYWCSPCTEVSSS